MPWNARCIMKLDPNNNDAMSSVGNYLGIGYNKYSGTVVGIEDGCLYGIPWDSKRIVKYDPINGEWTSHHLLERKSLNLSIAAGALGRDGCIYAVTLYGMVLKINTTNNSHCFVGNSVELDHDQYSRCWGDAVLGIDGCIYWPPRNARCILKYDPHTNQASLLVGDDFGNTQNKWRDIQDAAKQT